MKRLIGMIGFLVCLFIPCIAMSTDVVSLGSINETTNPLSIAVDKDGRLYVGDPLRGVVNVYSNSGTSLFSFGGIGKPLGISVSGSSVYVGDGSDGSVKVFDLEGKYITMLGAGRGEFQAPNGIAVSSAGIVYVTDSPTGLVKAYNPDGSAFSFGGLSFPTGIAVYAGDVYVVDTKMGMVAIYNREGVYKGQIGSFGGGAGQFTRPQGIDVDTAGNVYVTDAFQCDVSVFNNTGSYITRIGTYGTQAGGLITPMDASVDSMGKVFVTSINSSRVGIYGYGTYNGLKVNPSSLSFIRIEQGQTATATITVESLTASLGFTAVSDSPWLTLSSSGGQTPSTLTVTVNTALLEEGGYKGNIKVSSGGITETVSVSLEVVAGEVKLEVIPKSVNMRAQADGMAKSVSLIISGSEGAGWSVNAGASSWLSAMPFTGTIPGTSLVTLNPQGMLPGTYLSEITVSARTKRVSVPVRFELIDAGNIEVRTNHPLARFEISGAISLTGSGISATFPDVASGAYTVSFGLIKGFKAPMAMTDILRTGKVITFTGEYNDLRKEVEIVTSAEDEMVRVFRADGSLVSSFRVFSDDDDDDDDDALFNSSIGDINGDGMPEIMLAKTNSKARVRAFTREGVAIDECDFLPYDSSMGADVTVKDLNLDGKAEIITGSAKKSSWVKVFSFTEEGIKDTGISFIAYDKDTKGVNLSSGDIDGDGLPEIITSPGKDSEKNCTIKAFKVNTHERSVTEHLSINASSSAKGCDVTTGDIDGYGTDSIIVLLGKDNDDNKQKGKGTTIKIFNGYGKPLKEFNASYKATSISAGDIDMDGVSEIIIGSVMDDEDAGIVEIFDAQGARLSGFKAYDEDSKVILSTGELY